MRSTTEGVGWATRDALSDPAPSSDGGDFVLQTGNDKRQTADHLIIRKAHHPPALRPQPRLPPRVPRQGFRGEMGAPVNLDEEAGRDAGEISEIGSDRHLPPKMRPGAAMGAQRLPQGSFGYGRMLSRGARKVSRRGWTGGCLQHVPFDHGDAENQAGVFSDDAREEGNRRG